MILPDERDSFYPIASLFVYQLYVELVAVSDARGGRLKNRFNVLGDEWGNFTKIDMFPSMLTVGGRAWNQICTGLFYKVILKFTINIGREQGENIFDNNQTTLYLKTANHNTAQEISKKLGNYTTSVHSLSNSQSEGMKNLNTSTGNSENLTSRPLLTTDEILRIESPVALLMSAGKFSAITNLPDLHKWYFNLLYGMGNEEHNRKLREERERNRPKFKMQKMKLWDIGKSITKDDISNDDDSIDEYINNDLWNY